MRLAETWRFVLEAEDVKASLDDVCDVSEDTHELADLSPSPSYACPTSSLHLAVLESSSIFLCDSHVHNLGLFSDRPTKKNKAGGGRDCRWHE